MRINHPLHFQLKSAALGHTQKSGLSNAFTLKTLLLGGTALLLSGLPQIADADNLTWDTAVGAGIQGGPGTWDTNATANWTDDGGASNQNFQAGDNVSFGATAGTVTVSGNVSPLDIAFAVSGYLLTGGSITPNVGSDITVGNGISATIGSSFTGSNSFSKLGDGTLNLTGTSNHTGIFDVSAGTLANSGTFASAVTVSSGAIATSTGTMSGLITIGAGGSYTTSGTSSGGINNSGTTNAQGAVNGAVGNSGTFNVTDALSGNNAITNSGIFSTAGNMLTGFTSFTNTNILDMSNGVVTDNIALTSSLNLNSGTWEMDVDHNNASDSITVVGTVSLNGTLAVTAIGVAGNYTVLQQVYTIIDNDGVDAVSGTFANVTSNFAFLTPTIDYAGGTGNDVVLMLDNSNVTIDLKPNAQTGNQNNTAVAMDSFDYSGTSGTEVHNAFSGLTNTQVTDATQQIGGETYQATQVFNSASAQQFNSLMASNSQGGEQTDSGQLAAYADSSSKMDETFAIVDNETAASEAYSSHLWGKVLGGYHKVDSSSTSEGLASAFGGLTAGYNFNSNTGRYGAGLALGYSHAWYDTDTSTSDIISDNIHVGINANAGAANAHQVGLGARFAASFTQHFFDSERDIIFGGLTRTAKADYTGYTVASDFELRYGVVASSNNQQRLIFAPIAALHVLRSENDGFSESGAGGLNLTVDAEDFNSTKSELGFEIGAEYFAKAAVLRTGLKASWLHEFSDTSTTATMALAGSPTSYVVSSPDYMRDTFASELSVSATYGNGMSLHLLAEGIWSETSESYTGQSRISWKL